MLGKIEPLPQLFVLNGCESARLRGNHQEDSVIEKQEEHAAEEERGFWARAEESLDEHATLAEARQVDVLVGCDVRSAISSAGNGKIIVEVFSPAIFSSVPR